MWQGIQYVTSALSLVAFIAAAAFYTIVRTSNARARLIETADPTARTELVKAELEFFDVKTEILTREKQFQVAIEQIRARARRFLITSVVVCVLGLAFLALAAYAISSTIPMRSGQAEQKTLVLPSANAKPLPVRILTARIFCELRDLVRDDAPNAPMSWHRAFLLNGDYGVAIHLSLEVVDTGDLAISRTDNISLPHTRNFTQPLNKSMRDIYLEWKSGTNLYDCPSNLAATLGFGSAVDNGARATGPTLSSPAASGGAFGQTMKFVVTGNPNDADGWMLTSFENTSAVTGLPGVKINKMTFAFAPGPNTGKRIGQSMSRTPNVAALSFLDELLSRQ
ncbi:hypothetical protein [Bradyrhizobium sp. CCBAU 45384]|uniref:hypothetical protein n=1 Tax=Bradyrhizobium sp. CCBAU 45384 TaxID=858428 RepID=UPI0023054AEC|nr:hypothetical protein [Bradyrhizobium sp. CCBAU 45384]MDA9408898.1 hypothetical protein [Bradyrhizobium sp. CCBAU 45384]